jgi:hypothetical protein
LEGERVKEEDEYGGSTLYTCMKTEQWNLLKLFLEGGREDKEWQRGESDEVHCMHVQKYHNKPFVQLIYANKL